MSEFRSCSVYCSLFPVHLSQWDYSEERVCEVVGELSWKAGGNIYTDFFSLHFKYVS